MPRISSAPRLAERKAKPATHEGIDLPARKKSSPVLMKRFNTQPTRRTMAK